MILRAVTTLRERVDMLDTSQTAIHGPDFDLSLPNPFEDPPSYAHDRDEDVERGLRCVYILVRVWVSVLIGRACVVRCKRSFLVLAITSTVSLFRGRLLPSRHTLPLCTFKTTSTWLIGRGVAFEVARCRFDPDPVH